MFVRPQINVKEREIKSMLLIGIKYNQDILNFLNFIQSRYKMLSKIFELKF